jgi:hypothetical protein
MRERQPVAELLGRLVWRAAVERHERRRASVTHELRAPAIGIHAGHFNPEAAAIDHRFEPMRRHDTYSAGMQLVERRLILTIAANQTSERTDEAGCTGAAREDRGAAVRKINFCAQPLHRESTLLPHLFHRRFADTRLTGERAPTRLMKERPAHHQTTTSSRHTGAAGIAAPSRAGSCPRR